MLLSPVLLYVSRLSSTATTKTCIVATISKITVAVTMAMMMMIMMMIRMTMLMTTFYR